MARKKLSPEEEAKSLVKSIQESFNRWNYIKKTGTTDPFWPDGCNMNLVRNHILSDQLKLKELCKTLGKCPKEAKVKLPRHVSDNYMAPNSKAAKHAMPPIKKAKK